MRYGVVPQSGYGMTETCSHQYTLPDDMPEQIIGTCGRCCEGYEIRIWREDNPDVEAAPGEVGQIGGRGASLMLGYFDDQAATEAAPGGGFGYIFRLPPPIALSATTERLTRL